MGSFIGVPILIRGERYGNPYLTEKRGAAEFTEDDEEAVTLLAEFASLAIERARHHAGSGSRRIEPRGPKTR